MKITKHRNSQNIKKVLKIELIICHLYIIIYLTIPTLVIENEELNFNVITLKIKRTRNGKIFYSGDSNYQQCHDNNYKNLVPDMVEINGINQTKISPNYSFQETENTVKLIWKKNLEHLYCLFFYCSDIIEIDLSNFDTSKVDDMAGMFYKCSSLEFLNLSNFDTSHVGNMNYMFYKCSSLKSLDLSLFNTSQVKNMGLMFGECSLLESLDISHFDTSQVTDMNSMFGECSLLESLDISHFNTSQVTNMNSMFSGCSLLESLDLSHFNTSKVTNMGSMFKGCSSLEFLNLSHFDTTKVTLMVSNLAELTDLLINYTILYIYCNNSKIIPDFF